MSWNDPRTWTASETVTAAMMNGHVRDNFKAIGDAWTAYTPSVNNWTIVNGSFTGSAYIVMGKLCIGRMWYTVGSSDTKSSTPSFSLPVNALQSTTTPIGTGSLFDTSGVVRAFRYLFLASAGTFQFTTENDTRISPTAPWTWATGDLMVGSFMYETA